MQLNSVRPYKVPEILFYSPQKGSYSMLDTVRKSFVGEMSVSPRKELYISHLHIYTPFRRRGYGTKFLDFAKMLSERMGLNGNLRVMAGPTMYDIENPPHVFYRKYGFTTSDEKLLKTIDYGIKNNIKFSYVELPPEYMVYCNEKA